MAESKSSKLQLRLTDEQLEVLKPLLKQTGKVKIAGEVHDGTLSVSFLACNAAFIACNAPFNVTGTRV